MEEMCPSISLAGDTRDHFVYAQARYGYFQLKIGFTGARKLTLTNQH